MKRIAAIICLVMLAGCGKKNPNKPAFWIDMLESGVPQKVEEGFNGLARFKDAAKKAWAVKLVIKHFQKNPERASIALGNIGIKNMMIESKLIQALDAARISVQIAAARALGRVNASSAVGALLSTLKKSRSSSLKVTIIESLSKLKSKAAVKPLCDLLNDYSHHPQVHRRAVEALGRIGDPQAITPLIRAMFINFKHFKLERWAKQALITVTTSRKARKQLEDALYKIVMDQDPAFKRYIDKKMNFDPASRVKKQKLSRYSYSGYALIMLGDIGDKNTAQKILPLAMITKGPNHELQHPAIIALGSIGDESVVPTLIRVFRTSSMPSTVNIIIALMKIGDQRALRLFRKVLLDKKEDHQTRVTAAAAISRLGGTPEYALLSRWRKQIDGQVTKFKKIVAKAKTRRQRMAEMAGLAPYTWAQGELKKSMKRLKPALTCKSAKCWGQKLKSGSSLVRDKAAYMLRLHPDKKKAEKFLLAALGERNREVRDVIIASLLRIGGKKTLKVLERKMDIARKTLTEYKMFHFKTMLLKLKQKHSG